MDQFLTEQLSPFLAQKSMAFLEASLRILLIGIVAYGAIRALKFGLGKLAQVLLTWREREDKERVANEKRVKTLTGMLQTICLTLVWVIGIVMSLDQLAWISPRYWLVRAL